MSEILEVLREVRPPPHPLEACIFGNRVVFSKFFQRQLIYFLYYLKIYELDTGTNGLLNRQLLNAHTTGLKRFAHPCNACKSTIVLFMEITFIKMIVLGVLVGSSAGAGAAPPSSDGELLKSSSILQEEVDLATARIRSSKQFEAYLAATPSSVAFKLPPSVLSKFRRSMVFTERGLASFSYDGLIDYLNTKELYELLGLFGVQRTISSIPGIVGKNEIERKIIEVNDINPRQDSYCLINQGSNSCKYEYKSMCSQACSSSGNGR
ncbi:hypothetical protein GUH50_18995 [Xanthomonas citri pv. citri]|nr:hypothetical protein [Xanthomonas citri pv. citri]